MKAIVPQAVAFLALALSLVAPVSATDYTWNGGTSSDWHDSSNWTPNGVPGTVDTVTITSGALVNLGTDAVITGFTFTGGTFAGSGRLLITNTASWTAGIMSGTGEFVVGPDADLAISGSQTKILTERTLIIQGIATWQDTGNVYLGAGAAVQIDAGALLDVQNDESFVYYTAPASSVNNFGTLRKSAGGATTTLASNLIFNNAGIVQIWSGTLLVRSGGTDSGAYTVSSGATLAFGGGTRSLEAGATISGPGSLNVAGANVTHAGSYSIAGTTDVTAGSLHLTGTITDLGSPVTLSGGTLELDRDVTFSGNLNLSGGTLSGTGDLTVSDTLNWNGGILSGTGELLLPLNSTLTLATSRHKYLQTRALVIQDTATWQDTGNLYLGYGAELRIDPGALFDIQNDESLLYYAAPLPTVNNLGTIRKSSGSQVTIFGNNVDFNNLGTVEVQFGTLQLRGAGTDSGAYTFGPSSTLSFTGAIRELDGTAVISGAGSLTVAGANLTHAGEYAVSGATEVSSGSLHLTGNITELGTSVSVSGGTMELDSNVTFSDILAVSGGTLKGTGDFTVNGSLGWSGGTIDGDGQLLLTVNSTLALSNSSHKFLYRRMLIIQDTATCQDTGNVYLGYGAVLQIDPGGLLDIQNDESFLYTASPLPAINNLGTLRKSAGSATTIFGNSVQFTNQGTVDIQSGMLRIQGDGSDPGTYNISADSTLAFNGGARTLEAAGSITGAGTFAVGGAHVTCAATYAISGGTEVTAGTLDFLTDTTLIGTTTLAGGTLTGTGNLTIDGVMNWTAGILSGDSELIVPPQSSLTISGTNHKTLQTRLLRIHGSARWEDSGYLYVSTGAVLQVEPTGLFEIRNDSRLYYSTSPSVAFNNSGTVRKLDSSGTSRFQTVAFNNGGRLELDSGVLELTGPVTHDVATLEFSLRGPTDYGQLDHTLSADIPLNGTLITTLKSGFVPALNDSFELIQYTSFSGGLTNWLLPALNPGLAWRATTDVFQLDLTVIAAPTPTATIRGTVESSGGSPLSGVTVYAFATDGNQVTSIAAVTDPTGAYAIPVVDGVWQVGVRNLAEVGYQDLPGQTVVITGADQIVHFVASPLGGSTFTISLVANPVDGGQVSGGGSFAEGTQVSVVATPDRDPLPYVFVNWTESGISQTTDPDYTFPVARNRNLIANFTLETYSITATNDPPTAGTVSGQGIYEHGATATLTAYPEFGYEFDHWSDAGASIGTSPELQFTVTGPLMLGTHYRATNLVHTVTTATDPPSIAVVAGAGTYNNGNVLTITAPDSVTDADHSYTFYRFLLNGAHHGYDASFTRTLATTDATTLNFTAVYSVRSLNPLVNSVSPTDHSPVGATDDYRLTIRFDRSMLATPEPLVELLNAGAAAQPTVPSSGTWSTTSEPNDTYETPAIVLTSDMDGTTEVFVSAAQSLAGRELARTNILTFTLDATPPEISGVQVAAGPDSARIRWATSEPASSQVEYGTTAGYGTLSTLQNQRVITHSVTLNGLGTETLYHYRGRSADAAGNLTTSPDATFTTIPAPDLRPVDLQTTPEAGVLSGSLLTIRWNDTNAGPGIVTESYYDHLVVSNITADALLLDTLLYYDAASEGPIAAGATTPVAHAFQLPDGPDGAGELLIHITTDAAGQIYEDLAGGPAETNNETSLSAQSTLAAYPDLQSTDLQITPAQPVSGAPITISWQTANAGDAVVSTPFYERLTVRNLTSGETLFSLLVYLDASPGGAGPLLPSTSVARQHSVTLPDGQRSVGTLECVLTTDSQQTVYEHNAGANGESNNQNALSFGVALAPYPDLQVTSVTAPASASPGETVPVVWTVANTGTAEASDGWSDQVFLSIDNALGDDTYLTGLAFDGTLPASQVLVRTQWITLPAHRVGPQWFVVRADAANNIFETVEDNNLGLSTTPLGIPTALSLSFTHAAIAETAASGAALGRVERNGSLADELVVGIHSADPGRLSAPSTVTLPPGQSHATFPITPMDNELVDGDVGVLFTVSTSGFNSGSAALTVIDDDQPLLTLRTSTVSVSEGDGAAAAIGYLTRNANLSGPLTVALLSDQPSRLRLPTSVIIPATEASITFDLETLDNTAIEGPQQVRWSASASGYPTASKSLEITDDDIPMLGLEVERGMLSEGDPTPATVGTVTRVPAGAADLIIALATPGFADLVVPNRITLPAGATGVEFDISVRDDALVNPARSVPLTASPVSAQGAPLLGFAARVTVEVLDNDGPTLTLRPAADLVAEGGSVRVSVSRNTLPTEPLTITLSNDRPDQAQVPASLEIPANSTTTTFLLEGLVDAAADGSQMVTLQASAPGFNPASTRVSVTDIDLPDLRVTSIVVPPTALTEDQVPVSWVVANNGLATGTGTWSDRVYLSTDAQLGRDTLLASATFDGAIDVDTTYSRSTTVTLPDRPADYWILVVTDAADDLDEGSERNNTTASATAIAVAPPYTAVAATDIEIAPSGTAIPITGQTLSTLDGTPVPLQPLIIQIRKGSYRRTIVTFSDADGNFTETFQPLASEAGDYQLGAAHPQVTSIPDQDQFALLGFRALPTRLDLRVAPGTPLSGQVRLLNLGSQPVTGLSAGVTDLPIGISAQLSVPTTLEGSGELLLDYTLSATSTEAMRYTRTIRLTSAEGVTVDIPLTITVVPLRPVLNADPPYLRRGMLRGEQTLTAFDVTNTGGAPSGELQVVLPEVPWMSVLSDTTIASLLPGETTTVTLALNPASDLPLTRYDGTLGLVGPGTILSVPYELRAVSEAVGDLQVTVTDEYTYYVANAPNVTNAHVRVRDPITFDLVAEGVTDADGQITFASVPEGPYTVEASADRHDSQRQLVHLVPGVLTEAKVFLSRQTVTYRWTVVPTEIEDHYRIVLESVFETEVPIPVVVIEEPHMAPIVVPGEETIFEIALRNEGLIAAQHVRLRIPYDERYFVTALVTNIGTIPAKSRLEIPVSIRLRSDLIAGGASLSRSGGGECEIEIHPCLPKIPLYVLFEYECGDNGWQQKEGGVDLTPLCTAKNAYDCYDSLRGGLASRKNIWKGGCAAVAAYFSCVEDLSPCKKLALTAACEAATGGPSLGGSGSGALACLCDLLKDLDWSDDGDSESPSGLGAGTGGGFHPTSKNFTLSGEGTKQEDCRPAAGGASASNALAGGFARHELRPAVDAGVCARVRIRIEQEAVMTRTAFLGTLEIENDGPNDLSGITIDLEFRDRDGNAAADKFVIQGPRLSGLSDVMGGGILASRASGSAQYTFIPNRDAAPDAPAVYHIGGTLRYVEDGQEVVVPLMTSGITVFPEARLVLDYFQQRDVYSDDPFTDEVEPAEPFALGLQVKNHGAGAARKFRISSAQPKIIENEKGLLIDFKIIGTQVGDQPTIPSLTADFGRLDPGQSQSATWWMTCSLQGKFIEYTATFEHVDNFGSTNLSLIDSVAIHELIRAVQTHRPGDDAIIDFLVNDDPDPDDLPDALYLSDGTTAVVNLGVNANIDRGPTLANRTVQLTATMPNGWTYLRLPNPGPTFRLAAVTRSDGLDLPVNGVAWTTDRSYPESQAGAVREELLHLLDFDSTGSYTLTYVIDDSVAPQVVAITGITPGAQPAPVDELTVEFSEPIDPDTLTLEDLALTWNGAAIALDPSTTIQPTSETAFRIGGLAIANLADGNYQFTVLATGIFDYGNNAVLTDTSLSWALGLQAPVVTYIQPVTPDPRNQPVSTLDVMFSKPLSPLTLDHSDLILTRDGGPNLIQIGVTIVPLTSSTFRIGGLAALTADSGEYRLSVLADGVSDVDGNSGVGRLDRTWICQTTGPQLLALETVVTNPRNIVVPSLDVTFSKAIDPLTFDYQDITLTRDGGGNLAASQIRVEHVDANLYRIREFSWVSGQEGVYTLTVHGAGIRDLAGNPVSGLVSSAWTMDTTVPTTPTALRIAPDLGLHNDDNLTATNTVNLTGQLDEENLTVRVRDSVGNVDLGLAEVNGMTFAKEVVFATEGAHELKVTAIDAAGNFSEDARLSTFIDLARPTAEFEPIVPDPRNSSVAVALLTFSEAIHQTTFHASDLHLSRDGSPNLITRWVTVQQAVDNSYLISGLEALTSQSGRYVLSLKTNSVADLAGGVNTLAAEISWTLRSPNQAPALEPIPDAVVGPGQLLTFTNSVHDPDLPANRLSFQLDPGAPAGATVNSDSGVFRWTPTRDQAPADYSITVRVTDDGLPPLASTRSFTVTVTDYIEVRLGRTTLRAGNDGSLPIRLTSSGALTNLDLTIAITSDRLANLSVNILAPEVAEAVLQPIDPSRFNLRLTTASGTSFTGSEYVALLTFNALSEGPSELLQSRITNVQFDLSPAQPAAPAFTEDGQIVVVEEASLLEAAFTPEGLLEIALHGLPNTAYIFQYSHTPETAASWVDWFEIDLLSLTETLQIDTLPPAPAYIRVVEAAQP